MADTEEVPESRPPRSMKVEKKRKFRSVNDIALGFNGGGHSATEGYYLHHSHKQAPSSCTISPSSPQYLLMADKKEVPHENRLPRSKKVKEKRKFKSVNDIALGFNGRGHSATEGYYLHHSHVDCLKSFGPRLEEEIGLLKSEKKDENLRTILTNHKHRNVELDDCISLIGISIPIIEMPILPPDKEAEEASLKQLVFTTEHLVLADTNAESESHGGIESGLKALIKNLEEQMECITDLIRFLQVDGSAIVEMGRVIRRLCDLLENESRNIRFLGRD